MALASAIVGEGDQIKKKKKEALPFVPQIPKLCYRIGECLYTTCPVIPLSSLLSIVPYCYIPVPLLVLCAKTSNVLYNGYFK